MVEAAFNQSALAVIVVIVPMLDLRRLGRNLWQTALRNQENVLGTGLRQDRNAQRNLAEYHDLEKKMGTTNVALRTSQKKNLSCENVCR